MMGGNGTNLPMLNRLSWQPEYSENEFSGVEVCSAFGNEPSEQSGDNAMKNIARCINNNKNFEHSLEDIIMSTTKLQSVERTVAIPCKVGKNTTQGISNLNLSYPNSQKTQQELTGAIMSKSQKTPEVPKTAGVIMKLKVIGQKLMTGLTKPGSQVIPDGVEAELTNIAEQKSSAANEGYIIMCQDKKESHIATQNSKMEKTGQSNGPIRGSLATKLRKATNYVAELGQSIQQTWLGGKVVARFATALVFGVVVSGSMMFSNAVDAQVVKFTNATATFAEPDADGMVDIPFEVDADPSANVVVTFETETTGTALGDATAGDDFTAPTAGANNNTAMIAAGTTRTGNIQIQLKHDLIDEPNETFKVKITNVTGGTASTTPAELEVEVTITDNDAPPIINMTRTPTTDIVEGTNSDIVFTIVPTGANTTTTSARDIVIQVDVTQTTNGSFFQTSPSTVTLSAGSTSVTNGLVTHDDLVDETDGSFTVAFEDDVTTNDPVHYTKGATNPNITVNVTDNDAPPVIQVARDPNPIITEGADATFTYSIFTDGTNTTTSSARDIVIQVTLTQSGSFYNGDPSTFPNVTLPAGQPSVTDVVATDDDPSEEANGSITVTIEDDVDANDPVHYTKHETNNSVTTVVNDNENGVSFSDAATAKIGTEASRTVSIPFVIDTAPSDLVTVTFATTNGTAIAGVDFTEPTPSAANNTATISSGATTGSFSIEILDDDDFGPGETFTVRIVSASSPSRPNIPVSSVTTTVEITDNDNGVSITEAATAKIGTEGTNTTISIPIKVETAYAEIVTVTFSTSDGTAEAGEDFVALVAGSTDTADIAANVATGTFEITITDDFVDEPEQSFTVTITGAVGASGTVIPISTTTATTEAKITDNDAPPVILVARDPNSAITEGETATYTYSIFDDTTNTTTSSDRDIDIQVTLTQTGDFYDGDPTTFPPVTLPAGENSVTSDVVTEDDAIDEANGSITVTIEDDDDTNSPPHYTKHASDNTVSTDVNDNDNPVSITDATTAKPVTEGTATISIPIEIDTAEDTDVTVTFTTTNGTAVAGEDFVAPTADAENNTAIITGDGTNTTGNIVIEITDDLIDENAEESFTVTITAVSGGNAVLSTTPSELTTTVNITDNDDPPVIQVTRDPNSAITEGDTATFTYSVFTDTTNTTKTSAQDIAIQVTLTQTGDFYNGTLANFPPVTLPAGDESVTNGVATEDDAAEEANGSITVTIEDDVGTNTPAHYTKHATNNTVTTLVNDNDIPDQSSATGPVVSITNSIAGFPASEADGTIMIPIELSEAPTSPATVEVTYITSLAGTGTGFAAAGAGNDFTGETGSNTVTISTGTTGNIPIEILQDTIDEPDETFIVEITGVTGGSFTTADYKITVTIEDDDAAVSFTSATATEVENVSGGKISIPIEIDQVNDEDVVVTFETSSDGTAQPVTDFIAPAAADNTNTATIVTASNNRSGMVEIELVDDHVAEEDETFTVTLTAATTVTSNETILIKSAGASIEVTITDDDPTVSFTSARISEDEDVSGEKISIPIQIDQVNSEDVIVTFTTTDGTATVGSDFMALIAGTNDTATIDAGETMGTFEITLIDDNEQDPDEAFTVNITGAVTATSNTQVSVSEDADSIEVTINDDDIPLATIPDASDGISVDEDNGTVAIPIDMEVASSEAVEVTFEIVAGGTATSDVDYEALTAGTNDSVTISANQTTGTFEITLTDDQIDELDETFTVRIVSAETATSNTSLAVSTTPVEVTITDDEAPPIISMTRTTTGDIAEGAESGIQFAIAPDSTNTSATSDRDIVIQFIVTEAGTNGSFFDTIPETATIPAGMAAITDVITTHDDMVDETDGSFTVTLRADLNTNDPELYTVGATTNIEINVTDNDDAPVINMTRTPTSAITEGANSDIVFAIFNDTTNTTTSSARDIEIQVTITEAGSNGSFFETAPTTVTLPAGQTSVTDGIVTHDDELDETDGMITVSLEDDVSTNTPAHYTQVSADNPDITVNVTDNDAREVQFTSTTATVDEDAGTAVLEVSVAESLATEDVEVTFATAVGTATAADFVAPADPNNKITISGGDLTGEIEITITDDTIYEVDETFTVMLTAVTGGTLSQTDVTTTVTITEDDAPPVIQVVRSSSSAVTEGDTVDLTFSIDNTYGTTASSRDITFSAGIEDSGSFIDPTITSKSVTITASETMQAETAFITILQDTDDEANGTITMSIPDDTNDPAHYTKHPRNDSVVVVVNDNDYPTATHLEKL